MSPISRQGWFFNWIFNLVRNSWNTVKWELGRFLLRQSHIVTVNTPIPWSIYLTFHTILISIITIKYYENDITCIQHHIQTCIYAHIYTHARTHTHQCTHIHTHICTCTQTHTHTHTHTYTHTFIHTESYSITITTNIYKDIDCLTVHHVAVIYYV